MPLWRRVRASPTGSGRGRAAKSRITAFPIGLAYSPSRADISWASAWDAIHRALPHMSDFNRGYARTVPADRADMSVDAGLRAFMLGVYNKMALGLLLSAVLAWVTADFAPVQQLLYVVSPEGRLVGFTPLGTIIRFVP